MVESINSWWFFSFLLNVDLYQFEKNEKILNVGFSVGTRRLLDVFFLSYMRMIHACIKNASIGRLIDACYKRAFIRRLKDAFWLRK